MIHAEAPIRICDNGGWTDTWVARRGKVFNIAVRPAVAVQIDIFPRDSRDAHVVIHAENYGLRYAPRLDGEGWGPHPLIEAALRAISPPDDFDIEVRIRSDAPAGASTGTSAALLVALLGALDRLVGNRRAPNEIAIEAHAVETIRLSRQCGVQDQLCSTYGGLNFIEITDYPHAVVTPLNLAEQISCELERRLALIYLGRPHRSSAVHEKVMLELSRLGPDCAQLEVLRALAEEARDAALAGDFEALGQAMQGNTEAQAQLHADLVSPDARRVFEIAQAHGAIGWKVNGAGGTGGSVSLLCSPHETEKRAMIRAIEQENSAFVAIPIAISRGGLRIWQDE